MANVRQTRSGLRLTTDDTTVSPARSTRSHRSNSPAVSTPNTVSPKRGRGRGQALQTPSPKSESQTPILTRGRTCKKIPIASNILPKDAVIVEQEDAGPVQKRGRGRPRKKGESVVIITGTKAVDSVEKGGGDADEISDSFQPVALVENAVDSLNDGTFKVDEKISESSILDEPAVSLQSKQPTLEVKADILSNYSTAGDQFGLVEEGPSDWAGAVSATEDKDPFSSLTVEHLEQLESVLSSDEGLKMLEQSSADAGAIADMAIDDNLIQASLNMLDRSPMSHGAYIDDESVNEVAQNTETDVEPMLTKSPTNRKKSPPSRRSVRVTELEQRNLAEKIRQENIKKEKEMLEQLNPVALSDSHSILGKQSTGKKTEKKDGSPVHRRTSQESIPTTSHEENIGATNAIKDVPKKDSHGGWIPGQVKVINKKHDPPERHSLDSQRRHSSSTANDLFKPDDVIISPDSKKARKMKAKKHGDDIFEYTMEGSADSSSDSEDHDDEWMEEDDTDKLWCVCRQPHDNRFMICCDRCEEWYHGDCVGITKRRGRQMEQNNEEYICSLCKEKEVLEKIKSSGEAVSTKPVEEAKAQQQSEQKNVQMYGEIRKKVTTSDKVEKEKKKRRFGIFHCKPPRQHCIGSGCDNWAVDGTIYCSPKCIAGHAKESLTIIQQEKSKTLGIKHHDSSSKSQCEKPQVEIVVLERHTGRIVNTGANAPTASNLCEWLTRHPTFEVLRPVQQAGHVPKKPLACPLQLSRQPSRPAQGKEAQDHNTGTKAGSANDVDSSAKKPAEATGPEPGMIRSNVRKTLQELLRARIMEVPEEKYIEADVRSIVHSIEHELYKYYGDTNSKYKARYRSLIFNIKDPKNKGLFRKIAHKKLKPAQLVRMTPDELASKELHQWREHEMKSELEKIQKNEELAAQTVTPVRKITHKGEVEVVDEDLRDLDFKLTEESKNYDMDKSIENESKLDHSAHVRHASLSSAASLDVLSSVFAEADTTSQHNAHLFDANCKVCTGKVVPPTPVEVEKIQAAQKGKVAHRVMFDSQSMKRMSSGIDLDKIVEVEMSALRKEIKQFEEEDKRIEAALQHRSSLHGGETSPHQEPSSTVKSPVSPPEVPSSPPQLTQRKVNSLWKGFIDIPDISKFFTTAHVLYGPTENIKASLPDCLDVVGRIQPNQIWEYLEALKNSSSREIVIFRFAPVTDEEKEGYRKYFTYLSSKKRCGVVGPFSSSVKDMYIIPLASHEPVPQALKGFKIKDLDVSRSHMLLGLIVHTKAQKRPSVEQPAGKEKKVRAKAKQDDDLEPYSPPEDTEPSDSKLSSNIAFEEYDPSEPLVPVKPPTTSDKGDDPALLDPIVSAYSNADSKTLNAEDAPGAAPYSPGQEEMDVDSGEELYDPMLPLVSQYQAVLSEAYDPFKDQTTPRSNPLAVASSGTLSASSLPISDVLSEQQKALKTLKEKVEQQERLLELQRTQLAQQLQTQPQQSTVQQAAVQQVALQHGTLPKSIQDLMSGRAPAPTGAPEPYNVMEYLKRTIASKKVSNKDAEAPPLPPSSTAPKETDVSDRPKISFPLSSPNSNLPKVYNPSFPDGTSTMLVSQAVDPYADQRPYSVETVTHSRGLSSLATPTAHSQYAEEPFERDYSHGRSDNRGLNVREERGRWVEPHRWASPPNSRRGGPGEWTGPDNRGYNRGSRAGHWQERGRRF